MLLVAVALLAAYTALPAIAPVALVTFVAAFLAADAMLPFLIRRMALRGLVGIDLNKLGKPKVSEMGGIAVMLGSSFGIMVAIFAFTYLRLIELNLTLLLAALSTVLLVGFLGMVDDIIGWKQGIRQWQHALVPLFAALPLMAVKVNNPPMVLPFIGMLPAEFYIPFFGMVSFGLFYSLVLVPIGITGASNSFNMLAGFNGLEAGLGILGASTLLFISYADLLRGYGSSEAIILLAAIIGALLAFLRYNRFPARVFGGDSLTLMVGASIAAASIIGNMEKIGIMVMAIFFVELAFKAKHRFQSECFGIPQSDGTLKADPRGGSLTQWVMRRGRFTEPLVVGIILAMQAAVCIAVFSLFMLRLL